MESATQPSSLGLSDIVQQRAEIRKQIAGAMAAQAAACQPLHEALHTINAYIIAQVPAMTDEQLMNLRFQSVEDHALLSGQQIGSLTDYATEIAALEARIKELMITRGSQQMKVKSGHETHFVTKDSVSVPDMDKTVLFMINAAPCHPAVQPGIWGDIVQHIAQKGMWGLLTKALNKNNVKEILETGVAPDTMGIKFSSFKDLTWKRGKA